MPGQNAITVRWERDRETREALHNMPAHARKGAVSALKRLSKVLESFCKRGIQKGPATGRFYKRRSVVHRASAPGEWPMTDTGFLVRSIRGEVDGLECTLSASTKYAKWLEFGTRDESGGWRMQPRPFMRPTLAHAKQIAPKIFKASIQEAIDKHIRRHGST